MKSSNGEAHVGENKKGCLEGSLFSHRLFLHVLFYRPLDTAGELVTVVETCLVQYLVKRNAVPDRRGRPFAVTLQLFL